MTEVLAQATRRLDVAHPRLAGLTPRSRTDFVRFGSGPTCLLRASNLLQPVGEWAARTPDALAVIDDEGGSATYAELDAMACDLAVRLRAHGVGRGDRVGVFTVRGLAWVVSIMGVLRAGATWVPQDARIASRSTLEHIVSVAEIGIVLTVSDHLPAVTGLTDQVWAVDRLALEDGPRAGDETPVAEGDEVAVVIFTSGTTGIPLGVEVTHANLVNTVLDGPAALGIQPGMRVAQLLNIAFDMSVWEVFGALTHGASLVIRGSDLGETARTADVVIATPSVLSQLDPEACRSVRVVAVAGERCPRQLADTWSAFTIFHNACGPTEVSIVNTVHRLTAGDVPTIGAPIPNTSVYVLDDHLLPVETGEIGEMWAAGACVTRGYLGNPELTAERYRPDPFTGGVMFRCRDLVSWTDEGQLRHHGRTDDQVKVRGFRIELDAVTSALEHHPGVRAATTLLHHGELLAVVAVDLRLDEAQARGVAESARAGVTDALPYYCVPGQVILVDQLPVTARGKIDKLLLGSLVDHNPGAVRLSSRPVSHASRARSITHIGGAAA